MPPQKAKRPISNARADAANRTREDAAARRQRAGKGKGKKRDAAPKKEAQSRQDTLDEDEESSTLAAFKVRGEELRKVCSCGDVETLRLLLARSGDARYPINHPSPLDGVTPLMKASMYGHVPCALALLEAGAGTEILDERGRTALMLAAHNGEAAVIRELMRHGARPAGAGELAGREGASDDGRTALMLAANAGHAESVRLLLDGGAPLRDVDKSGRTALDLAREEGHAEVVEALEEHTRRLLQERASFVKPRGWKKLRRLRAGAAASAAFAGGRSRQPNAFAAVLNGDAALGASALSWLNGFAKSTSESFKNATRVTRGEDGRGSSSKQSARKSARSFLKNSFRRSRISRGQQSDPLPERVGVLAASAAQQGAEERQNHQPLHSLDC